MSEGAAVHSKKKLIIHIGTYKTASSHVQNTFFDNKDFLEKAGVVYPLIGIDKNRNIGQGQRGVLQGKKLPKIIEKLKADTECNTYLISAEIFSSPYALKLFFDANARNCLQGIDVQIVMVLRSYVDFVTSLYRQFSKSRYLSDNFEAFLNKSNHPHQWQKTIEFWTEIVGADNINFINYEEDKQDIVSAILNVTNIKAEMPIVANAITNHSLPSVAATLCRQLRSTGIGRKKILKLSRTIAKIVASKPEYSGTSEFSKIELNALKERAVKEVDFIASNFNLPFSTESLLKHKSVTLAKAEHMRQVRDVMADLLATDHVIVKEHKESLLKLYDRLSKVQGNKGKL